MRLPRQLVPPTALLARVQWLFLGFWLLFWTALAVHIIATQPLWLTVFGVAGMAGLAAWWLRCYRQSRFPLWALTFELPLFIVVGLAMPDPLELVYSVIPFRAVYSRRFREVVAVGCAVVAVTVGVSVFGPGSAGLSAITSETNSIVGTLGFSGILYVATRAMAAVERSVLRERVVAKAVLAFGNVRHRNDLIAVVADTTTALFADIDPDRVRTRIDVASEASTESDRPGDDGPTTTTLPLVGADDDNLQLVIEGGTQASHDENSDSLLLLAHGASLALRQLSLQQTLEARAAQDSLTGAANRRSFIERTAEAKAKAEAGLASLWLLFVDVDNFKSVNDTYGHHVGDAVLVAFADRMRIRVDESDLVARLGGDEFAVLLTGEPQDDELGEVVAARIRAELARPVDVDGVEAAVSASVGVVRWQPGMDVNDLLRGADQAMYQHKRSRQQIPTATPVGPTAVEPTPR